MLIKEMCFDVNRMFSVQREAKTEINEASGIREHHVSAFIIGPLRGFICDTSLRSSLRASRLSGPGLACVAQLALTATRAPDLESVTSMLRWRKGLITLAFSTRRPLRSVIKEQSSTTDPHQTR